MSPNFGVFNISDDVTQSVLFDQANASVAFIGIAKSTSTLTSEAKWKIGRSVTASDGDVTVEWADEGDYTQVWDDRLTVDFITDVGTITPTTGTLYELLPFTFTTDDTAFDSYPPVAGGNITEVAVIVDVDATNTARVEVSLNGGTTVSSKLIAGGFYSIDSIDEIDLTQIQIKGNEVGILYYVTLIRKKS